MVNGIVSLISLSIFSLLVYRNAKDFCMLIYYIHWLALVIFWWSLRIFYVEDHVICKQWEFYFFFSNVDSFYLFLYLFFSALIAMGKTSKTMLNSNGESGHPCLLPDLRGNAFKFSPLKIMFAVCLSYIAFIMLRYVNSIPSFWRVVIINGCWFCQSPSLHLLR